ncbi:MAG: IPT/TIG domain-containing protein [Candidatus Krumholzibacteriia bacterium]
MRLPPLTLLLCLAAVCAGCGSSSDPAKPGDAGDPVVTALYPAGAGPGEAVRIEGSGFGDTRAQPQGQVSVGGVEAVIEDWSDTRIDFVMPDGIVGNWVPVQLTIGGESTDAGSMGAWEPGVIQLTNYVGGTGAGEATWSPDGEWIYYTRRMGAGESPPNQYDIWRVPSRGGAPVRVTNTSYNENWPDIWSNTGQIAFGRDGTENGNLDGDYDIWVAGFGLVEAVDPNFATQGVLDRTPAWSRDVDLGVNIAWSSEDELGRPIIRLGGSVPISIFGAGFNPRFDPLDGRHIVYGSYNGQVPYLYVGDILDGSYTLLNTPETFRGTGDWGVNGKIVYVSGDGLGDLWTIDPDGTNASLLYGSPSSEGGPRWSPTADRVVFGSHRFGNFDLYVYTLPPE